MELELFSFTELSNCALATANKAFKSFNFDLAYKMLDSISIYQNLQKQLLKVTNFKPYWNS